MLLLLEGSAVGVEPTPSFRPADIPNGLAGYWTLNEATGNSVAFDVSGNGVDLAPVGNPSMTSGEQSIFRKNSTSGGTNQIKKKFGEPGRAVYWGHLEEPLGYRAFGLDSNGTCRILLRNLDKTDRCGKEVCCAANYQSIS